MTISLGGAPGPMTGGMTSIGGRPVQQAVPTPELPTTAAGRPPAREAARDGRADAKPKPTPPHAGHNGADRSRRPATPTTGARETQGQAKADTGVDSRTKRVSRPAAAARAGKSPVSSAIRSTSDRW